MSKSDLPIYATADMTKLQRGRCHERYLNASLKLAKVAMKDHEVKRKSRWFYRVDGYWFLSAFVTVNLQDDWTQFRAKIEVTAKPMAVDPIYWHATDLAGNCDKPASFRCNAAFMLDGETFPPCFIQSQDRPPEDFAQAVIKATARAMSAAKGIIGPRSYSQFLEDKGQPKLQIMKYVTELMADGRIQEARACIDEESALFANGLDGFSALIGNGVLDEILSTYPSV